MEQKIREEMLCIVTFRKQRLFERYIKSKGKMFCIGLTGNLQTDCF